MCPLGEEPTIEYGMMIFCPVIFPAGTGPTGRKMGWPGLLITFGVWMIMLCCGTPVTMVGGAGEDFGESDTVGGWEVVKIIVGWADEARVDGTL